MNDFYIMLSFNKITNINNNNLYSISINNIRLEPIAYGMFKEILNLDILHYKATTTDAIEADNEVVNNYYKALKRYKFYTYDTLFSLENIISLINDIIKIGKYSIVSISENTDKLTYHLIKNVKTYKL